MRKQEVRKLFSRMSCMLTAMVLTATSVPLSAANDEAYAADLQSTYELVDDV